MLLLKLNITYVSQKAIKEIVIADFFIDQAIRDYKPMNFDFPNMDLMIILQIDEK